MSNREDVFHLSLACSEDKQDLFSILAERFNQSGYRLEDGRLLYLRVHFYDSETVIGAALGRDFPLICPESTLDLYDLENQWEHRYPNTGSAITQNCTFAVTPIVFLLRPQAAAWLGHPERPIGWHTLQRVAEAPRQFRVMRAHGRTGHGKLITVAQFIAGMEEDREHQVYDDRVISFVHELETATREYGLSDRDVIIRALGEGEWLTDLIVAQERNILSILSELPHLEAVLVYPLEGTVWADHPLALMKTWEESEPTYRIAFERLRQYFLSTNTTEIIMTAGFHSARAENLGSAQEVKQFHQVQPTSIQHLSHVTYGAPPMVLPGVKVVRAIGDQWESVEKPADVCLVVDISSSMDVSDKLPKVKSGIRDFLDRFKNPESKMSLIVFNNTVTKLVSLDSMRTNRRDVENSVSTLSSSGMTALFDAVLEAINELNLHGDPSHIQAIIALTDGQENASSAGRSVVLRGLDRHSDLLFFGIAYGSDADRRDLEQMSRTARGLVVDSSPGGIQKLFQEMARRV